MPDVEVDGVTYQGLHVRVRGGGGGGHLGGKGRCGQGREHGGHGLGKGGGCLPIKEGLCRVAGVQTFKRQLLYDLAAS